MTLVEKGLYFNRQENASSSFEKKNYLKYQTSSQGIAKAFLKSVIKEELTFRKAMF